MDMKVPPDIFLAHQSIFFKLINSTQQNQEKFAITESEDTKLVDEVFGNKFSQRKLKDLFLLEPIQILWFGEPGWNFKDCQILSDIISHLNEKQRMDLYQKFS